MLIRPPRFAYNPEILKPSRKLKERYIIETHYLPFELTLYRKLYKDLKPILAKAEILLNKEQKNKLEDKNDTQD